jgi:hypothetical protein
MKMYYYNPNNYSAEFFVMAENKTKAHEYLLKHLENKIVSESCYAEMYQEDLEIWKKVNPLDIKTFPGKYTLDEHEIGSVIESEIA